MLRIEEAEVLDDPELPAGVVARAYRDMAAVHYLLGDVRFMVRAIRADPFPVRRVLDVGCGAGLVLRRIARSLGVEAVGCDIRPRLGDSAPVPVVEADACADQLPAADVAFCMNLCHHLSPHDVVRLVRNVGRFCRRFILLDLVRHPLPLALFRAFLAPLVCDIDAQDGQRSIRRSYTPNELRAMVRDAIAGSGATFRSSLAPLYLRQVVDISYAGCGPGAVPEFEDAAEEESCFP